MAGRKRRYGQARVLRGCIDIGSNTTRLLVADCAGGTLTEVCQRRAFTRLGEGLEAGGEITSEKVSDVVAAVAAQARLARELGASSIRAVGTAALRRGANRAAVLDAVRSATGVVVELLTGEEEARLAFLGATHGIQDPPDRMVGVIDVGGGSTELIAGTVGDGVAWWRSFELGSGDLAERHLRSDPPADEQLDAVRADLRARLAGVDAPRPARGLAVGGSATSLRRLVGSQLHAPALERGLCVLVREPAEAVARRYELDPRRVRLLPAGLLILEAAAEVLGCPLEVSSGGLREGLLLDEQGACG
jgi:exopolyphosphatase/guanosine-5'-triphosphate,3'-diphosphate pyrophosphatase